KERFMDRCELVRSEILDSVDGESQSSGPSGFSAMDAFFSSSSRVSSDFDPTSACDGDPVGVELFACKVLAARDLSNSPNTMKSYANQIKRECEKAGADMRPRMSAAEYNSYANSGVHAMGGFCGPQSGLVVIQQQNSGWNSTLNTALAGLKIVAPLAV